MSEPEKSEPEAGQVVNDAKKVGFYITVLAVGRRILGVLTDSKLIPGMPGAILDFGRKLGLWYRKPGL